MKSSVSRLAKLGDESVSQKGIRGLEFKAELEDLFLRLDELSRGGPAIHARWDSSSWGVLDVSGEDPRESVNTYRLAESPECTRRVWSKLTVDR